MSGFRDLVPVPICVCGLNFYSLEMAGLLSRILSSSLELFSDASGVGYRGYFQGSWFSAAWPVDVSLDNITVLEGFAVYVSVYL